MKKHWRALVAATWLIAGGAQAAGIENGGFETPGQAPQTSTTYFNGNTIGAWTVFGGPISALGTFTEAPITFTAHGGTTALDLTGPSNTLTGGLFQDVATLAGTGYTLSFWVGNATANAASGRAGFYALGTTIGLRIDGVNVGSFTNDDITVDAVNWKRFTFNFTAANPVTRIAFANVTPSAENYLGLDDVSLSAAGAIPEPSTWARLTGGFGLAGTALRRRSSAARAAMREARVTG